MICADGALMVCTGPDKTKESCQREVQLMMDLIASRRFVLSANFHGGAVVANYPWDGSKNQPCVCYARCFALR
jgi:hypothetical protein